MKIFVRIFLGVLIVILLLIGGGLLWLTRADLKPMAEKAASDALGRPVVAETFSIGWGNPLHVELTNLKIANAPWGSEDQMITLKNFSADVDAMSLWRGTPVYHHLRAEGLKIVLERDDQGQGNWQFGSQSSSGGFALIPKNRTQFPTLLDMALNDALITYRTYSGNILRIQLDNVAIAAPDDVSPVTLKAAGAYGNTPLALDATTASFRDMRDAQKPFKTVFALFGKTARLDFDGTQMEPLDFDGVEGNVKLKAEELDNLLASFGADVTAAYPLIVDAHMTRQGDHWELTQAKGKLDGANLKGQLILDEGSKGSPDKIKTELTFDRLDLDKLITNGASGTDPEIVPPKGAGVILDAKLRAWQFVYARTELRDVELAGHLDAESIKLNSLRFPYAGGRVTADLEVTDRVTASSAITGIDAGQLAKGLGADAGDLAGEVNGRVVLDMPSGKLSEALAKSQGAAIVSMGEGSIKRSILEKVSTDIRTIFREKEGDAPIRCLGGVVILKDGIATVAPLRLMAKGAIVNGGGTIDLVKKQVDLRAQSERKSTGFFALDLPVAVSGSFANVSVGLAEDKVKKWAPPASPKPTALDPDMHKLMSGNPCLN